MKKAFALGPAIKHVDMKETFQIVAGVFFSSWPALPSFLLEHPGGIQARPKTAILMDKSFLSFENIQATLGERLLSAFPFCSTYGTREAPLGC